MSAGTAAWRVLGTEAWRLLDSGRLRNAARLGAALSAVGGSMPALLLSCRPPDRAAPTPLSIARGAVSHRRYHDPSTRPGPQHRPALDPVLSCAIVPILSTLYRHTSLLLRQSACNENGELVIAKLARMRLPLAPY